MDTSWVLDALLGSSRQARMSGEGVTGVDDDVVDPRIGTTLGGSFTVLRLLGRGGMGAVYEVRGPRGETLAAKVITRGLNGSTVQPQEIARLVREGRAAATIVSPHVVRALAVDQDEATGLPFLILELLSGLDLAKLVATRAPIAATPMVRVVRQAALGLAAAHEKGIIHRDVKPANLFLHVDASGEVMVKVCDFGIAKQNFDQRDVVSTELTQTGGLLGSPAYMSPEQTQSAKLLDARTDIWSLAAVLYEALSGQRMWPPQSSLGELILAICTRPVPRLDMVAPWLDPLLCDVVHRGLERDIDARWPSVMAFADALAPFTGGTDVVRLGELTTVAHARPRVIDDGVETRNERSYFMGTTEQRAATPRDPIATTALSPRTRVRAKRRRAIVISVIAAIAASAFGLLRTLTASPVVAKSEACTHNAECRSSEQSEQSEQSAPAICRIGDHVCVTLGSDDCRVLASPDDLANDATIWVGAMLPLRGPMAESYGNKERDAVELARRDFSETVHGLPPLQPGGPRRPVAVVMCDDSNDPDRVARHLIDDLHVPAVIGFALSKEVIDLADSHFNPKGVLALATNTSSILRSIPTHPGEPRLVWRTTVSTDMMVAPRVALLRDFAEPQMRATPGALSPNEPLRVAFVRIANSSGLATSDRVVDSLRFNGKSVAENGAAFRQIVMGAEADGDPSGDEIRRVAAQIATFLPHVVLVDVDVPVLPEVERAWPKQARFQPIYLGAHLDDATTTAWVREHPDLRRRAFGCDTITTTSAVAKYVLRHNEVFDNKISPTLSGIGTYDAFYVLAYAIAALGAEPITGRSLARSIPRLMSPGARVDVGPAGIVDVLHTLEAGANVDLVGTTTTLDFDLDTGEASADFDVFCATPSGKVPSGMVFRSREQKLEGTLSCPRW